jgi:diguanylate cyclase (GGDEF)-like protein
VLESNADDDRLQSGIASEDVAELLADSDPRACLAIRYGRQHEEGSEARPLVPCALCRSLGDASTMCVPSMVGGQAMGSVLVTRDRRLDGAERARVRDSVTRSSPMLANLRTLAQAQRRAATDGLTGLPNAARCRTRWRAWSLRPRRSGTELTAIMIDLDHFKALNDEYGHDIGNRVLAAVGRALRHTLRASDLAGRYGGEEFLVLLPDTDQTRGAPVAEKLREAIEALTFTELARPVTASFGVAGLTSGAPDAATLVRAADRAMYRAKQLGRNCVELAAQNTERVSPPSTATTSPVT